MEYKPREGIERVIVCGVSLLVPTRRASEECPNIATITMLESMFWRQLVNGKSFEEICAFYSGLTFKPMEAARPVVGGFFERLAEKGFVIPVEGTDEES